MANLFGEKAVKVSPKSYSIKLIATLIKVQSYSKNNWCEVYEEMKNVRTNNSLLLDFRIRAIYIVFKYINGYIRHCWFTILEHCIYDKNVWNNHQMLG